MIEWVILFTNVAILIVLIGLYFKNKNEKIIFVKDDNHAKGKELAKKFLFDEIRKNHEYLLSKQEGIVILFGIVDQKPVKLDPSQISISEWQKVKYEIANTNPKLAHRLSKLYDYYISIITVNDISQLSKFKDYYWFHQIVEGDLY